MYLPVAIIIGVLQTTDSYLLYRSDGKPSKFSYFMSITEFMWVIISVVYLFTSEGNGIEKLSPIIYISYTFTSFIVGSMMMKGVQDVEKIDEIRVPESFMRLGMGFGLLYAFLNGVFLVGIV